MQQTTILTLETRDKLGSRAVQKLRAEGLVPGVIYGHDFTSKAIMAPYREVAKAYLQAGKHAPVEVQIDGKKSLTMIKRVDIEPVKHKMLHVAFHVVKQNEEVQTEVPLKMANEEEDTPAEKAGLVLIKNLDMVQIKAFPRDLPESITIDGEKLVAAGDSITVGDLVAPAGVTILSDPAQQIISAVEPAALAAANDAAGGPAEEEVEAEGEEGAETPEGDASENGGQAANDASTGDDTKAKKE